MGTVAGIHVTRLPMTDLADLLATPFAPDELAPEAASAVVVEGGGAEPPRLPPAAVETWLTLPAVIVGAAGPPRAELADVVAPDDEALDRILAGVERNPLAATALAVLLRGAEERSVADGLVAESTTYSMLQGGPEFAAWRSSRPVKAATDEAEPAVRWTRHGDRLEVVLDRPRVHNAYNTAMRDGLIDALTVAAADPSVVEVHLRGAGRSFCSGGDLDEFGSRADPASAHGLRLRRSAARLIHLLRDRTTAYIHGACMGSGIELPAFAGRIVAHPDTRIGLPEVALGLIPGAGGTVSLPRRIGRHRTALLALSGDTIDAATAHDWGLVDELEPTN